MITELFYDELIAKIKYHDNITLIFIFNRHIIESTTQGIWMNTKCDKTA